MSSRTEEIETVENDDVVLRKIQLPYHNEKRLVNPSNFNERFAQIEHRRRISQNQVNGIYKSLLDGQGIGDNITVNERYVNGKKVSRILDGNHRVEAIKQLFNKHPQHPGVEVGVNIYENLSDDEEKRIIRLLNLRRRYNFTHHIEVNQEGIPIFQRIVDQEIVPGVFVKLYPGRAPNRVGFEHLISAYVRRNSKSTFMKTDFDTALDEITNLKIADDNNIRSFVRAFVDAFGPPGTGNIVSTSTGYASLTKMYFANVKNLGHQEIIKRWKTIVHRTSNTEMSDIMKKTGEVAVVSATEWLEKQMNFHKSKNLAIKPW